MSWHIWGGGLILSDFHLLMKLQQFLFKYLKKLVLFLPLKKTLRAIKSNISVEKFCCSRVLHFFALGSDDGKFLRDELRNYENNNSYGNRLVSVYFHVMLVYRDHTIVTFPPHSVYHLTFSSLQRQHQNSSPTISEKQKLYYLIRVRLSSYWWTVFGTYECYYLLWNTTLRKTADCASKLYKLTAPKNIQSSKIDQC